MSTLVQKGRISSSGVGVFRWNLKGFVISHGNEIYGASPPFLHSEGEYQLQLRKEAHSCLVETTFLRLDPGRLLRASLEFRLTSGDESVSPSYSVSTTERTAHFVRFDLDVGEYLLERKNSVLSPALALSIRTHEGRTRPERHSTCREFVSCAIQTEVPDLSSRDIEALTKLQEDFKQLVLSEEDSDVIIKVKGEKFPAHRNILRARSPVLKAMFGHDMEEKLSGGISIDDCDPKTFLDFLNYLYTGNMKLVAGGNVCHLYTASDKYEVLELKTHCTEFMKTHISTKTFCDFLTLALKHQEGDLVHAATEFFIANAVDIVQSVEWQIFHQRNHTVANELFLRALSRGKNI